VITLALALIVQLSGCPKTPGGARRVLLTAGDTRQAFKLAAKIVERRRRMRLHTCYWVA